MKGGPKTSWQLPSLLLLGSVVFLHGPFFSCLLTCTLHTTRSVTSGEGSSPGRKNTQIGNGGADSSASTHFSRLDPHFPG